MRILAEAGDESTLTRAAAQFEAANPGVTIDASYLGWDDFMATIKLKLADNNPPDLAHGNQGFTVDGTLVQNGLIISLENPVPIAKVSLENPEPIIFRLIFEL